MSDTQYWRIVANDGRGALMTKCLHEACDAVAKLETDRAELVEALELIAEGYLGGKQMTPSDMFDHCINARAILERTSK